MKFTLKHALLVAAIVLCGAAALTYGAWRAGEEPELARTPAACNTAAAQARIARPPEGAGLRERVAGLLVTGFPGDHADHDDFRAFAGFAQRYPLAGVIHLERNIRTAADVMALNGKLARALDRPFIMVDEEGGIVTRLRVLTGFPVPPAAKDVAAGKTPDGARRLYRPLAEALATLGFNLNLGPVVDLERNADNPVIARYRRAYSAEPAEVVDYARAFAQAHAEAGVLTVLKHFPGHGSSATDTHHESADISWSWHPDELLPFAGLIEEGHAPLVMTSHVSLSSDLLGQPEPEIATFSPGIVAYLRERLCHEGLIVSDDMTMAAVGEGPLADRLEKAIRAGHDLVLLAAPRWIGTDRIARAIDTVAQRAEADPELAAMIETAFARVAAFKRERLIEKDGEAVASEAQRAL